MKPGDTTQKFFGRSKHRKRNDRWRFVLGCTCIAVFSLLFTFENLHSLNRVVFDHLIRFQAKAPAHDDIVLIEITDRSIEDIGDWPWPMKYHAVILELLGRWGARQIYFDDRFDGDADKKDIFDFKRVLERSKARVFLPSDFTIKKQKTFWVQGIELGKSSKSSQKSWVSPREDYRHLLYAPVARELISDSDGHLRRYKKDVEHSEKSYPHIASQLALFLNHEKSQHQSDLIPFTSKNFQFRFDYADLVQSYYALQRGMEPKVNPEDIQGKTVLIGHTEVSRAKSYATALGMLFPIEIYAHILNGIVLDKSLHEVGTLLNFSMLMIAGTAFLVGTFFLPAIGVWLLFLGFFLLWMFFCVGAFFLFGTIFLWVYPALFSLVYALLYLIFMQLTSSKEKTQLFHLATRDGLTDLYVIRHFRVILNQMTREAYMRKEALAVVLMDIDNFKQINDTYGHPAGDAVLKKVAEIIGSSIRQKRPFKQRDIAARYGGEEFIVMTRQSSAEDVRENIAERIRKNVEGAEIVWQGKKLAVTMSLGVGLLRPDENVPDQMVHRADKALYRAKHEGKNQVCVEEDHDR